MEVKSKHTRGHHLPCLSGLSLAPLLSSPGPMAPASERSTPISAHSLTFGAGSSMMAPIPPASASADIAAGTSTLHIDSFHSSSNSSSTEVNNNNNNNNNLAAPTKAPLSSKLFGASTQQTPSVPPTSIFFPPLPTKQMSSLSQSSRTHKGSRHQDGHQVKSNRSPKSADINMNLEQELEKKASSMQHLQQQQQHHQPQGPLPLPPPPLPSIQARRGQQHQMHTLTNLKPPLVPQTKLNSPLPVPSKSFPDFNENSHLFPTQQFKLMSLSNDFNSASKGQQNTHDDNYHLYHEPIDLEDEPPMDVRSATSQADQSPKEVSYSSADNSPSTLKPNFNDLINDQRGSPFFKSSNPNTSTNNHMAAQDSLNSTPTNHKAVNKSPTSLAISHSPSNPIQASASSLSFSNRTCGAKHKNDISAEIYFSYVSLKSNERANSRSRSYHGPKNTCFNNQLQQSPYIKDATKNLSSSSVLDLPISPTTFTSTMIRDHCVRELIETESNYVHALEMILSSFAKPLECLLRKEDYQIIFGHIKYFHHIHSGLQAELVKAALRSYNKEMTNLSSTNYNSHTLSANHKSSQASSNPTTPTLVGNIPQFLSSSPLITPPTQETQTPVVTPTSGQTKNSNLTTFRISSCFLNMREKFLKYGEYCATLSKAQALLDELCRRDEAFASQLDRCQQDANEGKFKLRDLLSLPMQRILKYHLLLAQLIKNTSSTNDDYYGLKRAYETMVDLGQYINEVKRDTEAIQIINKIEQTITGLNMPPNTQLTDYGRFIHDGFVRVKSPLDAKTKVSHDSKLKIPNDIKLKQKRYFFVFDKVMLLCKGSNYQYKEALVLSEFQIEQDSDSVSKHIVKDKWNYNFNLIHNTDPTNVYSFSAKTLENKLKLLEAIQRAMDNIRPVACRDGATNHEFLMHTFEKASSCDHCGKLLLGLYYQGYRCRICFSSVHKKCIGLIKPCGPILPLKTTNTMTMSRNRGAVNEPTSPSIRSNCSEDDGGGGGVAASSSRSYVNFILNDYPWFVGRMERDTAQGLLENMPSGTFLVRVSPKHNHSYVISLNYNSQVKHMRILVSEDNRLYLSENRHFKSVIELVSWYEKNSLIESFPNLYAHLANPYKGNCIN